MKPSTHCPVCHNAIPADAPGGLCPSCALLGVAQPTVVMPPQGVASREEVAAAFPDLEVREIIGQGGMGVVFKARQPRLDRLVALKILPPHLAVQPGFSERFTREARALAKLHHPNIVTVFDFGESGGFFYLLMEFVNGVNLRKAMQAGVKPEQAMLLVPRICEALQFAHDHGVLHRDIKPENILLDTAGTPKLADFGIAKLADEKGSGLTLSGAALGTVSYMAPEQIEKPATVDHRADIYSLGVVFYEMLTGELPLGRFGAPSEKAAVSEGVDAVVMRALEKERERRQQSAGEMKTQVEHATPGGCQVTVRPPAVLPYRQLQWSRTAAWAAALIAGSAPIGMILFLAARRFLNPAHDVNGQLSGPLAGNIIIFGGIPALLGTLLGWKAVSDVRYHRGYLRGGGTAVTAALAIPLLTLIGSLFANFDEIKRAVSPSGRIMEGEAVAILAVLAGLLFSIWAVRAVWRFVHDGPPGVPLPPVPDSTAAPSPSIPVEISADQPRESGIKQVLGVLTALAGVGIPASAVIPGAAKLGLTPAVMVFVCAALGVLAGMWPGPPRTRRQPIPGNAGGSDTRSRRTLFGYPLWHFVNGIDPATGRHRIARGIIAIGPEARGFLAIGGRAHGVFALGGIATGGLAFGGIAAGLLTGGGLSLGLLAAGGGMACGGLARGGVAIGYNAEGGLAIGHVAKGGHAITDAPGPPDQWALLATEYLINTALTAGAVLAVLALLVVVLSLFASSDAEERPTHFPARRFLTFSLVLLTLGAGFLLSKKLRETIAAATPTGVYQSTKAVRWVDAKSPPFATAWDSGGAELVAVSQHPATNGPWWRMNGQNGAEGLFIWPGGVATPQQGERAYEFIFHLRDIPAGASPAAWRIENAGATAGGTAPSLKEKPGSPLPGYLAIAAALPESTDRANVMLGLASGTWRTLASLGPNNVSSTSVNHEGVQWQIMHGAAIETNNGTVALTLTGSRHDDWQFRVIAVDATGREISTEGTSQVGDHSDWYFAGIKIADVKEFRFQVRPYQWIEFRGIALKPAK